MTQLTYRGVRYEAPKMDPGLIQYFMNRKAKAEASAKELRHNQNQLSREQIIV